MKKTKPEVRKEKRFLRCTLTQEELLAAGKNQADKHGELCRTEADKKRIVADIGAKIAALEAELGSLAGKITSGYEFRDVPCTVYLGTPEPDKKTIVRDDSGETVGIEAMTPAEMQRELLNEQKPATSSDPLSD